MSLFSFRPLSTVKTQKETATVMSEHERLWHVLQCLYCSARVFQPRLNAKNAATGARCFIRAVMRRGFDQPVGTQGAGQIGRSLRNVEHGRAELLRAQTKQKAHLNHPG